MEKSKKQYFNEINIMRGMAVLCVVIGHSFNPTETPTILGFIKSFVYCFHMPAFFFISGFLEGEKRRSSSEKKQAIIKKAQTTNDTVLLFDISYSLTQSCIWSICKKST